MPKTIRKTFKRAVALISDLHAGSVAAPWPDVMKTSEGMKLLASEEQQYLSAQLSAFKEVTDEFECDAVWLFGDLIDGNNWKACGTHRVTPDLDLQAKAAIELLGPITKGRTVLGIIGSGYHDSVDTFIDQRIIEALGGKCYGLLGNLPLKGTNRIIQITHGEGAAVTARETTIAREGALLFQAEGKHNLPFHVDARIAGHWHWFCHVHNSRQHLVQLPAWADWAPWRGGVRSYGAALPDIGGVIMLVDQADRMNFLPFLYPRPGISDRLHEQS
jgi:hypothetical protein